MIVRRGHCSKMPCESCAVQFSVFRRKRACCECERYYCSGCLRRGGGAMCAPCRVLSTRPLSRHSVATLKVRDLQCFLQRQNVSTRGCVEKEELVTLCVSHVNSAAYRRRGPRAGASPFSSLKGFTNNINVFINSAFDLRNSPPAQPPTHGNCYNASHTHAPPPDSAAPAAAPRERFTTTPGGERDISVPVPAAGVARSASADSGAPRDSADCFEIEDLDDAGWEFVTRPADPLPNDSDVLIAENEIQIEVEAPDPGEEEGQRQESSQTRRASEGTRTRLSGLGGLGGPGGLAGLGGPGTPQRAASELELRRPDAADSADADSSSLQDEPLMDHAPSDGGGGGGGAGAVTLEQLPSEAALAELSVKQLKALLARNRVEFRGCLERQDLLARARTLWRDHAHYKDEIDNLPLEECCKICMAAPLECVLLECGHMAACTRCSKQLAECPICRQYVVRAVRVFRS